MAKKVSKKVYRAIRGTYERIIKIETSAICNSRCVWCWMYNANKVKPGLMDFKSFKKIIDLNEQFFKYGSMGRWLIEPYLNGEALLNPQLFDMLDYVVSKKIGLTHRFDTNLSVEIDIKRLMSFPWSRIWVNLGGITKEVHEKVMRHTSFELVIHNLKEMLEINKDIIYVKMNPTKQNIHQLNTLKDFLKNLGGKPENIVRDRTGFTLPYAASYEEKKYFFDNVISDEVKPYLRFDYDMKKENFGIKAKEPGCNFLTPCIAFDGRVTTCCHDQLGAINVGNAFVLPLEAIFKSNEYKAVVGKCKRQEFYFCKECN